MMNNYILALLEAIENDMIVRDDNGMAWYWGKGRIRLVAAEIDGFDVKENGYHCSNFEEGVGLLKECGYITTAKLPETEMDNYIRYGDEWKKEVLRNPKMVIMAMLRNVAKERDDLYAAKEECERLLKKADELFNQTLELCDDPNQEEEWIWKWSVAYYFDETDIPVHPLPEDMK